MGYLRPEVTKLVRKVVAPTVGLSAATNGNVVYRSPVEWILSGYTFDWVPDAFYLIAFAKALFIPSPNLLVVGNRLPTPGGSMRWPPRWRPPGSSDDQLAAAMSAAIQKGIPFVDSISTLDGFVAYVEAQLDPDRLNPRFQEQVVYGRILLGLDSKDAASQLRSLRSLVGRTDGRPMFREVAERADLVESRLGDEQSLTDLFHDWRRSDLSDLRIPHQR